MGVRRRIPDPLPEDRRFCGPAYTAGMESRPLALANKGAIDERLERLPPEIADN